MTGKRSVDKLNSFFFSAAVTNLVKIYKILPNENQNKFEHHNKVLVFSEMLSFNKLCAFMFFYSSCNVENLLCDAGCEYEFLYFYRHYLFTNTVIHTKQ